MTDADKLTHSLDQIDTLVRSDKSIAVKAFGLLLLGKTFDEELDDTSKDPTELVLKGGIRIPER